MRHRGHKSILKIHPHTEMLVLKHNHFWRWYEAEKKERQRVVVFIVAVKCFYVFASKEETLSTQWEIFIFHRRVQ